MDRQQAKRNKLFTNGTWSRLRTFSYIGGIFIPALQKKKNTGYIRFLIVNFSIGTDDNEDVLLSAAGDSSRARFLPLEINSYSPKISREHGWTLLNVLYRASDHHGTTIVGLSEFMGPYVFIYRYSGVVRKE
jgi:hypothetical protein